MAVSGTETVRSAAAQLFAAVQTIANVIETQPHRLHEPDAAARAKSIDLVDAAVALLERAEAVLHDPQPTPREFVEGLHAATAAVLELRDRTIDRVVARTEVPDHPV